jgi:hypothetical protein
MTKGEVNDWDNKRDGDIEMTNSKLSGAWLRLCFIAAHLSAKSAEKWSTLRLCVI